MTSIIVGDCLEVMRAVPDQSVHCCITSPPYWGLRDYGVQKQLGLEKTAQEYIEGIVGAFREVRRILRDDGTLWINVGNVYATGGGKQVVQTLNASHGLDGMRQKTPGYKRKNLIGIPWMIAFALQADGWFLRQDIIWYKANAMPESVTDRCTRSHEYVFLLSKSERYYFDHIAIREEAVGGASGNKQRKARPNSDVLKRGHQAGSIPWSGRRTRNKRSVWIVNTKPLKEAHFATFPAKLIEPCVLAGCPKGGTVLDPFFGAGTTGVVCREMGREFIGIELNPHYAEIARKRINAL